MALSGPQQLGGGDELGCSLDTTKQVIQVLSSVLNLGNRAATLVSASPLLGSLPELDSMAVVAVLSELEERFGFVVEDDEVDARTFGTVGSLAAFVDQKLAR